MRPIYRLRQFWQALAGHPTPEDLAEAGRWLGPGLMELFNRMQPGEKVHSVCVARQIIAQGDALPDLIIAALLHDVGKSRYPLRIWERVEVVLAYKLVPGWANRWGNCAPRGWKKPFVVAKCHAGWGADLAAQYGASPLSVALINRHQDPPPTPGPSIEDQFLLRLQAVDDSN